MLCSPPCPPPPPGGGCMMCKCPCERAPSKTWPTSWQTRGTTTCSAHCTPFLTPLPPNQPKDIARNAGWTRCLALGSATHLLKWKLDRSDEECAMCFGSSSYPLPHFLALCVSVGKWTRKIPQHQNHCHLAKFNTHSSLTVWLPFPCPIPLQQSSPRPRWHSLGCNCLRVMEI